MYLFPYVLAAALIFSFILNSNRKKNSASVDSFWEREQRANNAPAKDITNLDYITISLEALPFLSNPSKSIAECENTIKMLAKRKIINLSGISNTDLKMMYGVKNFTELSQCDENFLRMQQTFVKWGRELMDAGYKKEAVTVLEYALSTGCDAKNIFIYLKQLYTELSPEKLDNLILSASLIKSPSKDSIIKELQK